MDYSSAHVIFIIQYCNRLFSIAVDYNAGLVPELTRSRCVNTICAFAQKNCVVLINHLLINIQFQFCSVHNNCIGMVQMVIYMCQIYI